MNFILDDEEGRERKTKAIEFAIKFDLELTVCYHIGMLDTASTDNTVLTNLTAIYGDVIHVRTRATAIDRGEQHLLEGVFASLARMAGFTAPVHVTDSVMILSDMGENESQTVVMRSILHSARDEARNNTDNSSFLFSFELDGETHELIASCAAVDIDDESPCITIMTIFES